jgi:hypothetical protein
MRNRRPRTNICVPGFGSELPAVRAELERLDASLLHGTEDWDDVLRRADALGQAEAEPHDPLASPVAVTCGARPGRTNVGCAERGARPGAALDALGWGTRAL